MKTRRLNQAGMALIITLIFLAVMTTAGVTMLTSTRIGEDIAGNFQEINRAFQTAETGVVASLGNESWNADPTTTTTGNGDTGLGYYAYDRRFNDFFPLKRRKSQVFSAIHFQRAQFSIESNAEVRPAEDADPIARSSIGEGVYLVVPKL